MKKLSLLLVALLTAFSFQYSYAQWTSSTLPSVTFGNYMFTSLASNEGRLLLGSSNGIYISDNDGASWQTIREGFTNPNINAVYADAQVALTADNYGKISISHDNGSTWQSSAGGTTYGVGVLSFARQGNRLFANSNSEIYFSDDQGNSWQNTNNNLPGILINNVFVEGNKIFLCGGSGVLYMSEDNGASWQLVNTGLPESSINSITSDGTNFWVGASGGVYKSIDGGFNWSLSGTGISFFSNITKVIYLPGGKLLASDASSNLYVSTNGGNTWTYSGQPFTYSYISQHTIHNSQLYIVASSAGVYHSADNGQSWTQSNNGIELALTKLNSLSGIIYGTGSQYNYTSADEGQSWVQVSGLPQYAGIECFYTHGSRVYAGTEATGLYYSDNNGVSWSLSTANGLPESNFGIRSIAGEGNNIYLATNYGIMYSTDNGVNWQTSGTGLYTQDAQYVAVHHGKVFATSGFYLHESSDNGQSWVQTPDRAGVLTYGILINDDKIYAYGIGIQVSSDGGENFTALTNPDMSLNIIECEVNDGIMFVLGNNHNIYISNDDGTTWHTFSEGLPSGLYFGVRSIEFTENYAVISTAGPFDIFRRPLSEINIPNGCPPIGNITGEQQVCSNTEGTVYTITSQQGATFQWSVSSGDATIVSGGNTNAVTIDFGNTNSQLSVIQTSPGCDAQIKLVDVTVNAPAPIITGPAAVCENGTATYTIQSYPNSEIVWSATSGTTIATGGGSSVGINFTDVNATISVSVSSNDCVSPTSTYNVTINPAVRITHVNGPLNVCTGQTGVAYSVNDYNMPSTQYTWTVPTGFTLESGQGSQEIQVTPGFTSGMFTVQATNECGTSEVYSFYVGIANLTAPEITASATNVNANQAGISFAIPNIPNVTYHWEVPADATIYYGQGLASITVNFGSQSGDVKVTLTSTIGCGSVTSVLPVTVNQVTRPTASARLSSCGDHRVEFYNLSGAFPLRVSLTDYTYTYSFTLISPTDNIRLLPANKTYTMLSVMDADYISSQPSDVSGTFTTSAANLNVSPAVSGTGDCSAPMSSWGSQTGGVFEWYYIENDRSYTLMRRSPVGGNVDHFEATRSGNYVVAYRNAFGCYRQSSPVSITLNNPPPLAPVITPAGPVTTACGEDVDVTLTGPVGYPHYYWYKDGQIISGANANTHRAVGAGTYNLAVSNDGTCSSAFSADVVINQTLKPARVTTSGNTFIYCGKNGTINVTNAAFYAPNGFRWYKDGVLIPGQNLATISVTENGLYTVEGSQDGSCYSDLSVGAAATYQNNYQLSVNGPVGGYTMACGSSMNLMAESGFSSYNWYRNGTLISGENTYILAGVNQSGRYEVEAVGNACTTAKTSRDIFVGSSPSIIILSPMIRDINCGATTTLTTSGRTFYQWYKDGAAIPNSNSASLVVSETGSYTVTGSNDGVCYSIPGTPAQVNVGMPGVTASISAFDTNLSCGEKANLNAMPNTYAFYKWYRNGSVYATTNVPMLETSVAGTYSVAVSNNNTCYSNISSGPVTITLTAQLASLQINEGQVSFEYLYNSGNNTLQKTGINSGNFEAYQWQYSIDNTNWNDISGANGTSYDFNIADGAYRLKGTFAGCAPSYSNSVFPFTSNITLTNSPSQSNAVMCRAQAKLTTTAGFTTYTWKQVGGTEVITSVPELIMADHGLTSGLYRVTVSGTDEAGVQYDYTSGNITVTIAEDITPVLSIPTLGCAGATGLISISSPSGNYSFYEWKNTVGEVVGTTKELMVTSGDTYTLHVKDYAGCEATVNAPVNASQAPADFTPVVTTQNGSSQFCIGGNTTIIISNITSLPYGTYTYNWYKDGKFLSSSENELTLPQVKNTGTYTLQINPTGSTTKCMAYSNAVTLTNYPAVNTQVTGPAQNQFCIGEGQVLTATGGSGYTYKWGLMQTTTIPASISPVMGTAQTFAPPQANQPYGVELTDANGCKAVTGPFLVTFVNAPVQPVIRQKVLQSYSIAQPTISSCQSITLTAKSYATETISYPIQWYKDGAKITNATSADLSVTSTGRYTLEYGSLNCPKMSSPVQVNINTEPTVVVTFRNALPASTSVLIQSCNTADGRAVFIAPAAAAGQGYTYKWYQLDLSTTIPNTLTPVVSTAKEFTPATNNKYYRVEVTNTVTGCTALSSPYQLLLVAPPTTVPTVNSPDLCREGNVTLRATGTLPANSLYRWADANNVTLAETTGNTYTLTGITTSGTYYVSYSKGGCTTSNKATAVVTVHNPVAPIAPNVFRCGNGPVLLKASGANGNYSWFNSSSSNNPMHTGEEYTTPSLTANKTYYVASYKTVNSERCHSDKVAVEAIIKTIPVINISASDLDICRQEIVQMTASGADTYQWKSGNTVLASTALYEVAPTTTTTYTAEGMVDGCIGKKNVTITVNASPLVNVTSSNGWKLCPAGSSTVLTASGASTYAWHIAGNTTPFSTADKVTVSPSATIDYVLLGYNSKGCRGAKIFSVEVKAPPAQPAITNVNICKDQPATLSVNSPSPSLTYKWYNSQQNEIGEGTTYTTGTLTTDKTYFVKAINKDFNNCASYSMTVMVNVIQLHAIPNYTSSVCSYGGTLTFRPGVIYTPYVYTWYSAATGGTPLLVNSQTYSAPVGTNTSATYYVEASYTEAGVTCVTAERAAVRINTLLYPNLAVSPGSYEMCNGNNVTITASGANSYTWNTGATTASITVAPTATTSFIVTGRGTNGCVASRGVPVKVNPLPPAAPVVTSSANEVCEYGFVTFTAAGAPSNGFYEWKQFNSKNQLIGYNMTIATNNTWTVTVPKDSRVEVAIRSVAYCTGPVAVKTVNTVRTTSLTFDGINDQIQFPESGSLFDIEGSSFSIGANVKFHPQQPQTEPTILSKRADSWTGYRLYTESNGTKIVLTINGTNYKSNQIPSIHDGACHTIIVSNQVTMVGPGTYFRAIWFYLDGVNIGAIGQYNPNRTVKTGIMRMGNDYYNQPFKGELHDMIFWRKAIGSSEIAQYTANPAASVSTEILHYNFGHYSSDQIINSSTYWVGTYHYGTLGTSIVKDDADPIRSCNNACFINDRTTADFAEESEVVMEEKILQITAHPNPFELSTVINLSGFTSEKVELILTDLSGQPVWRKESHPVEEAISVGENLNSGVYILRVVGEGEVQTIKIVKAK